MKIVKISMTPQMLSRRSQDIARKDSQFDIHQNIMIFGLSGKVIVKAPVNMDAPTNSSELGTGDYIICTAWLPFKITVTESFEALVIAMPGWWLNHRPPPRGMMSYGLMVSGSGALSPILESAINVLISQPSNDVNGQACVELFGDILTYSMNVAFLSHAEKKIQRGKSAPVLRYVLQNFADEELSPQKTADELKCSLSTVHKSFAAFGTTFNQTVIKFRLSMASYMLWLGHLNISQIVFEVGFKDVSHFNRLFKRKYGINPSEYKRSIK